MRLSWARVTGREIAVSQQSPMCGGLWPPHHDGVPHAHAHGSRLSALE